MRPRLATQTILHIALAVGAVSMILPFLWMLSTSLKPESEIFVFPPTARAAASRYFQNASVPARTFFSAIRDLKAMVQHG